MKTLTSLGLSALAMVWTIHAAETGTPSPVPPQAPTPVAAPAPMMPPPGANLPHGGPQNAPQQQISEDFMKLVMEASAKIEAAKKQIQDRQAHLIATDPTIKKLQADLESMQKQINAIIEADPEYTQNKLKRDILATVMPELPKPPSSPMGGPGGAMGGRPIMPPPTMRMPPAPPAASGQP